VPAERRATVNVERFRAIAGSLREEIETTNYPALLEEVANGLQQAVKDPSQPSPQEQVSKARGRLETTLRGAPSNDFSPAWKESLKELGITDLVGDQLADRIEEIFTRNEITPSAAAEELSTIHERVQELIQALNQATAGLDFFEIGTEELEPGEFEIGFMIPRQAVDDDLGALGREFVRLKKIVLPLSELAGEGRPQIEVRSIASSEFEVFLHSTPAVALMFAKVLDLLLGSYQKILDIRLKHRELAEQDGVPDEVLEPLSQHASGKMEETVNEIVEKAVADARLDDEARRNELRTELRLELNALAERIDRGYNVEVRTGQLPPPPEDDEEAEPLDMDPNVKSTAETVLGMQKQLSFMNVSGKPILRLEQPPDDESEDGGSD
jgi:hypothetical protein